MIKTLGQLLPSFKNTVAAADGSKIADICEINKIPVSNLVFDSREVTKDSLFFALPGIHADGNDFIADAINAGANAVIYEGELSQDQRQNIAQSIIKRAVENAVKDEKQKFAPVLIKVPNSRIAMAPVSSCFYDNPSERLIVIGVTGTEGKSSTVSFIWQLLKACGEKAGFISTVEYSFGEEASPNPQHQTTPEAPIIQRNLNQMLENGCKYAVLETSSHGLSDKLNRCGNIAFDCAVFMNVTLEHLEFHKNFETYRADKANLFRALDKHNHVKKIAGTETAVNSIGIVNLEDESAKYFINSTKRQVYGFTTLGKAGKFAAETGENIAPLPEIPPNLKFMTASNIGDAPCRISFDVAADGTSAVFPKNYDAALTRERSHFSVKAPLPGAFNAHNIMAAIIAVSALTGLSFEQIAQKTLNLKPVKGRMTIIDEGQPFEVVVDYAHTPSSFKTVFPPLKKRCSGRIFAVFGSGGERDLTKRPLQGRIAAEFCDVIILTDEDPRGEDSVELLKMIADGAVEKGKIPGENLFITPDRPKAIRQALSMAKKGDVVLLLGKSHENSIIYKNRIMPYDEIAEAKKALKEML